MSDIKSFITDNVWTIVAIIVILVVFFYYRASHKKKESTCKNIPSLTYIPSNTFVGEKKGYVFKTDQGNTGYYRDVVDMK